MVVRPRDLRFADGLAVQHLRVAGLECFRLMLRRGPGSVSAPSRDQDILGESHNSLGNRSR
jgi:hypothetical protein